MSSTSASVRGRKRRASRARVVSLDAYRHAVRAAAFLRGCLHGPWLKEVRAQALEDGDAQVLVVILREDVMVRRCVPTSVDSIPVAVVVEGEGSR